MSYHWARDSSFDDDDLSSIHTYSTASTNATMDNQPGAGKTLDYVYQRLGRKLEDGIRKVMDVLGDRSRVQMIVRDNSDNEDDDEQSIISNETVDNLPGPGRTLDKHFYQPLGRRLENTLGSTADRLGFGPNAIERELLRLLGSIWVYDKGGRLARDKKKLAIAASGAVLQSSYAPGMLPGRAWKLIHSVPQLEATTDSKAGIVMSINVDDDAQRRILKEISRQCKKLLRYSQSATFSTKIHSLNHIINLVFIVPELREIFRDKKALETLEDLVNSLCHEFERYSNTNEYDALLVSSRRALFSIEENALNSAAKEFIASCVATAHNDVGWHSSDANPWLALGREFISLADHRKHDSFLVIRYARRAWDFLQDASVISVAFSDSSDIDDLASTFMDAFIRMQERGFYFTPKSLEPLELALLLTRMSAGTSFWPCSVGPVAPWDIGKIRGVRIQGFNRILDTGRFPPLLARGSYIISEHAAIFFLRDPRDDTTIYGLVDELPEPYKAELKSKKAGFFANMYALIQGMNRAEEFGKEALEDTVEGGLDEFGQQFGWNGIMRGKMDTGNDKGELVDEDIGNRDCSEHLHFTDTDCHVGYEIAA